MIAPGSQVPFEITTNAGFRAYWTGAIVVCGVGTVRVLWTAAKSRSSHLWLFFYCLLALFWIDLCYFLAELNSVNPVVDDLAKIGACIGAGLSIFIPPSILDSRPEFRFHKRAKLFFTAVGLASVLYFVASASVFFSSRYVEGAKYFNGYRVFPVFLMFAILGVSNLYVAAGILLRTGFRGGPLTGDLRALRFLAYGMIGFVPATFVVDYVRWVFPSLWRIYPREDIFVLPLYFAYASTVIAFYADAYASGVRARSAPLPGLPLSAALSRRERDIALLLSRGFSYKEVGATLGISMGTVQTYAPRIYRKLGISGKEQLIIRSHGEGPPSADTEG